MRKKKLLSSPDSLNGESEKQKRYVNAFFRFSVKKEKEREFDPCVWILVIRFILTHIFFSFTPPSFPNKKKGAENKSFFPSETATHPLPKNSTISICKSLCIFFFNSIFFFFFTQYSISLFASHLPKSV